MAIHNSTFPSSTRALATSRCYYIPLSLASPLALSVRPPTHPSSTTSDDQLIVLNNHPSISGRGEIAGWMDGGGQQQQQQQQYDPYRLCYLTIIVIIILLIPHYPPLPPSPSSIYYKIQLPNWLAICYSPAISIRHFLYLYTFCIPRIVLNPNFLGANLLYYFPIPIITLSTASPRFPLWGPAPGLINNRKVIKWIPE